MGRLEWPPKKFIVSLCKLQAMGMGPSGLYMGGVRKSQKWVQSEGAGAGAGNRYVEGWWGIP